MSIVFFRVLYLNPVNILSWVEILYLVAGIVGGQILSVNSYFLYQCVILGVRG